jgi:hypothetical protein
MYENIMGLGALKEDAMEIGKVGASALLGAAIAKQVVKMTSKLGLDAAGAGTPTLPAWANGLIPIAVGVAVHAYGKAQFPLAAPGVAAGMVAFGLADVVKGAVAKSSAETQKMVSDYTPFAGVDTYDSGLLAGLGYYDASVNRYMMAGSPTQVQRLMGAPLQVQQLAGGIGSTVVNGLAGAPMSAQVLAGGAAATLM